MRGLAYCGVSLKEVSAVVFYEKPFLKFERLLETYLAYAPRGLFSFITAMDVWTGKRLFIKSEIRKELKKIDPAANSKTLPLLFSEHHLSHAASAFYPSPFSEAAILTIDGVGEHATTSMASGNGKAIRILKEIHFPHSLGLLYSAITYFLGFKVNNDEYKIMGLAAYGNAQAEEVKKFSRIIETTLAKTAADGGFQLNMKYFTYPYALKMVDDKKWEMLFDIKKRKSETAITQAHCNLAYAFQKFTEQNVLSLCREIKRETSSENLCLAGGVALNGVINGAIARSGLFKHIFIQPASGDAGGALGAALAAYHMHFQNERKTISPDALQNSLLGDEACKEEIERIALAHGNSIKCEDENELCEKTATYINEGKVVGWFQGRMEFGPRALGNRSILADARNENMQKHLNLKIKNRESFRPFAPAVLEEDAHKYFEFNSLSPYMLQVHPVKKDCLEKVASNYSELSLQEKLYTVKSVIPAVTHVDFSARIQTVNREQHPLFWKLIHRFKQLTGCGLVINTSFNRKDEPIVCTATDAYNCFIQTGIDILVLGNYILHKP
jgi:carbamoyltransferase